MVTLYIGTKTTNATNTETGLRITVTTPTIAIQPNGIGTTQATWGAMDSDRRENRGASATA